VLAFLVAVGLSLTATGDELTPKVDPNLAQYKATKALKGTLRLAGPEDMDVVAEAWGKGLQAIHPEFKLVLTTAHSTDGAKQLQEGKQQVILMSRSMRAAEIDAFEKVHKSRPVGINVGVGALGVVVHPSNPLTSISLAQLDGVFSATPRRGAPQTSLTWGDVGLKGDWADRKIQPVIRSSTTSAHFGVSETVLAGAKYAPHVKYLNPSPKIVEYVAGDPLAIGFVPSGMAGREGLKAIPVSTLDGKPIPATTEAILDGRYPLVRRIVCYFKCNPGDAAPPAEVTEFLRFAQSLEGQTIVQRAGAIPLTREMVDANLEAYEDAGLSKD
jgi:phosphate transport system substrate-binding protein